MKIYYVKISLDYFKKSCRNVYISLKTFGKNEANARENVERMIGCWQDIKNFTIVKISTLPIYLTEYDIRGVVKYKNRPNLQVFYRLKAENKAEAEELFKIKTAKWKDVIGREITEISIY